MKRYFTAIAFLLFLRACSPTATPAQTTIVTGQVTDANGSPYVDGSWNANLYTANVPAGTPVTFQGSNAFQTTYQGQLDGFGNFTVTLPDNNVITPVGKTEWKFDFCQHFNPTTGQPCGSLIITITGASMNISTQIRAVPLPVVIGPVSNAALKPALGDGVQFVNEVTGSDTSDGLSRGSAKATIPAAIAALPSSPLAGGTVYITGNATYVLTSTLNIGNRTTTNVVLKPEGRLVLACNITNGTPCINSFGQSGIDCGMHFSNNCIIDTFDSTTNVSALVQTDPGGVNENVILNGVEIRDSHSATVSTALLYLPTAYDSQLMDDNVEAANGEIPVEISDASASLCPNNLNFFGLGIGDGFATGSSAASAMLLIKPTHGCPIGPVTFYAGDFGGHHLPANGHITEVDGSPSGSLLPISFYDIYEEGSTSATTGSLNFVNGGTAVNYTHITMNRLFASSTEYGFELSNAIGGNVQSFNASGSVTGGTGHNAVLNDINSTNSQNNGALDYRYNTVSPNTGIQITGDSFYSDLVSLAANPAQSGFLRLADGDSIAWRNHANAADILLGKNTSDQLTFAGNLVPTFTGAWTIGNCAGLSATTGIFQSVACGTAFAGGLGTSFQDATEIAAPANPAAGNDRLFLNSSTHQLACLTSAGASCLPTGGGWPSGTFTPGTGTLNVTYANGTGATPDVSLLGPASGTDTGQVVNIDTGAGSTQPSFRVGVQGVPQIQVNETPGANAQVIFGIAAATINTSVTSAARYVFANNSNPNNNNEFFSSASAPTSTLTLFRHTAAAGTGFFDASGQTGCATDGSCASGTINWFIRGDGEISATNFVDTALTPSTAAICANGVGGAFVNTGCAGGSGSPGGTVNQLQFNSAGAFGGIAGSAATTHGGISFFPTADTPSFAVHPFATATSDPFQVFSETAVSVPSTPSLGQVAGGALAARTDFVQVAYAGYSGVFTTYSAEQSKAVSASNLLTVTSPAASSGAAGWLPAIASATGGETKLETVTSANCTLATGLPENAPAMCAIGANWTEPTTGFNATGPTKPSSNLTQVKAFYVDSSGNIHCQNCAVPVSAGFTTSAAQPIGVDSTTGLFHNWTGAADATDVQKVGTWVVGDCAKLNDTVGGISDAGAPCGSGGGGGGTVTYTVSQTATSADNGKLVIMNCSAACAYTLPNPQPSTTFNVHVISIGSTLATIALGASMTWNGAASLPSLSTDWTLPVNANSATATDYDGPEGAQVAIDAGTTSVHLPGTLTTASNITTTTGSVTTSQVAPSTAFTNFNLGGATSVASGTAGSTTISTSGGTSTGNSGPMTLSPGVASGTGINEGLAIREPYLATGTITAGTLLCYTTTTETLQTCATTGVTYNFAGFATATGTANAQGVITSGRALNIVFDNQPVVGDVACPSTTTAGDLHDNGTTACTGTIPSVPFVVVRSNSTTSGNVDIRK